MATHATRPKRTVEEILKEASEIPNGSYPLWTTNDIRFLLDHIKEVREAVIAADKKIDALRKFLKRNE